MDRPQGIVNRLREVVNRANIYNAVFFIVELIISFAPIALSAWLMENGEPYWAILLFLWFTYLGRD